MKYFLVSILFWGVSCVTSNEVQKKQSYLKPSPVLEALDQSQYDVSEINSEKTSIKLYLKKDSALDTEKIKKSVQKVWPLLHRMLSLEPLEIALVDSEGPIGGGPLDSYIVTLYSTQKMIPLFKKLVTQATGWPAQESTQGYIRKYYADFADPEQAYIDDIVIHELAHTIFGFGSTKAAKDSQDWWFTFGLGLLYDRMVWNQIYDKDSPLFGGAVKQWQDRFAKIKDLDQRLIRPQLDKDEKHKLSRLQVYGHGKALIYLGELRKSIGTARFDQAVLATIKNHDILDYDQFINRYFLTDKPAIKALEKQYLVR